MRKLTIEQKIIIMDYVKTQVMTEKVKDELLTKLEKINDYETLWSDMERFINDYEFSYETSSDGQSGKYLLNWQDWS